MKETYSDNKFIALTHHNKSTHEKHTSPGVHKLKCNDRPKFYISQTGRSFKTRYTEHIEALTKHDILNI